MCWAQFSSIHNKTSFFYFFSSFSRLALCCTHLRYDSNGQLTDQWSLWEEEEETIDKTHILSYIRERDHPSHVECIVSHYRGVYISIEVMDMGQGGQTGTTFDKIANDQHSCTNSCKTGITQEKNVLSMYKTLFLSNIPLLAFPTPPHPLHPHHPPPPSFKKNRNKKREESFVER